MRLPVLRAAGAHRTTPPSPPREEGWKRPWKPVSAATRCVRPTPGLGAICTFCLRFPRACAPRRSQGCSRDCDNLTWFSCIYMAFPNPMWLYGYDFREVRSFRAPTRPNQGKTARNHTMKSAERTPPPIPARLLLLQQAVRFSMFSIRKHKIHRPLTSKAVSVRNLSAQGKWPLVHGESLVRRMVWGNGHFLWWNGHQTRGSFMLLVTLWSWIWNNQNPCLSVPLYLWFWFDAQNI